MEISFVIDPMSVLLGVILNWVVVFAIGFGVAIKNYNKTKKNRKPSISLDKLKI